VGRFPGRVRLAAQALAIAGVGVLGALLVWKLAHQTPPPKVGGPAPSFSLRRLDGAGTVSLASLRGKTVVLNFFASWCTPCKREAAALEQVWREYHSRGVVVLGIDTNDAASDARQFVSAHGVTYPTVGGAGFGLAGRYGVPDLPATFVVDSRGRIVGGLILGPVNEPAHSQELLRYLHAAEKS
jgi:cytochrome c biogenesis protein CcmG, thiol:disulfide interchange protein DsbE